MRDLVGMFGEREVNFVTSVTHPVTLLLQLCLEVQMGRNNSAIGVNAIVLGRDFTNMRRHAGISFTHSRKVMKWRHRSRSPSGNGDGRAEMYQNHCLLKRMPSVSIFRVYKSLTSHKYTAMNLDSRSSNLADFPGNETAENATNAQLEEYVKIIPHKSSRQTKPTIIPLPSNSQSESTEANSVAPEPLNVAHRDNSDGLHPYVCALSYAGRFGAHRDCCDFTVIEGNHQCNPEVSSQQLDQIRNIKHHLSLIRGHG